MNKISPVTEEREGVLKSSALSGQHGGLYFCDSGNRVEGTLLGPRYSEGLAVTTVNQMSSIDTI